MQRKRQKVSMIFFCKEAFFLWKGGGETERTLEQRPKTKWLRLSYDLSLIPLTCAVWVSCSEFQPSFTAGFRGLKDD